jgi:hypothetical protein
MEREEDWEAYRDGIFNDLQPVGQLEFVLAERAALNFWRMGRVTRFEVASIAQAIRGDGDQQPRAKRGNPADEQLHQLVKQLGAVEALSTKGALTMVERPQFAEVIEAACAVARHVITPAGTHSCRLIRWPNEWHATRHISPAKPFKRCTNWKRCKHDATAAAPRSPASTCPATCNHENYQTNSRCKEQSHTICSPLQALSLELVTYIKVVPAWLEWRIC